MEIKAKTNSRKMLSVAVKVLLISTFVAVLMPLILSLSPSEKADALGQPISVNIDDLSVDRPISIEWRGNRNYVVARSDLDVDNLNNKHVPGVVPIDLGPSHDGYLRSIRDDVFVVTALCPHKTCVVELASAGDFNNLDFEYEGDRIFWDSCHGWFFDLAGRYLGDSKYKANPSAGRQPQVRELPVPVYRFVSETVIELGRK